SPSPNVVHDSVPIVPLGSGGQPTPKDSHVAGSKADAKQETAVSRRADSANTKRPTLLAADRGRDGRAAADKGVALAPPKPDEARAEGRAEAPKPAVTQTGGTANAADPARDSAASRGNAGGGSAVTTGSTARTETTPTANSGG